MAYDRTPARIGLLWFKYENPTVNVSTESITKEHETIDDSIVVQQLGRKADSITIDATVAEYETGFVDSLVDSGVVSLRTERWSGEVIVQSTNTNFMRAVDPDGEWLYSTTIKCLEVNEATGQIDTSFRTPTQAEREDLRTFNVGEDVNDNGIDDDFE